LSTAFCNIVKACRFLSQITILNRKEFCHVITGIVANVPHNVDHGVMPFMGWLYASVWRWV